MRLALVLGALLHGALLCSSATLASPNADAGALRKVVSFNVGSANVKALLLDGETAWLGTSDGLIRFHTRSGEQRVYDNSSGLLSNGILSLAKMDGRIWVGTYGGGLSILDPATQEWSRYNIPEGLGDSFVYDMIRDPSGDIWIATWSGVNQVVGGALDDPSAWRLHTVRSTKGGLQNDWVYGLHAAPDGSVWLATEGGLARYQGGAWRNWTHADGLGASWERVAKDHADEQAAAAASRHHRRQRREQGLEATGPAYNPNYVVSLVVDQAGVVWAGTWGAGLSRFDGENWTSFTKADGLPGNHVFALSIEADRLWVGANQGLASFDGEVFDDHSDVANLNVAGVFAIEIGEGAAWVGGYGGASWYPQGFQSLLRDRKGDD